MAAADSEAGIEILRTLIDDGEAETLRERAARRREVLGVRADPLPPPPPPEPDQPVAPLEVPLQKHPGLDEGPPRFTVEVVTPETCGDDGLFPPGDDAGTELASLASIEAVAAVGITGEGKPYLLIDLITAEGRGRRVLRVLSSQCDPRHLVGRPDLSPLAALRELLHRIVATSKASAMAGQEGISGGRFPIFETVESYEDAVLSPLRVNCFANRGV